MFSWSFEQVYLIAVTFFFITLTFSLAANNNKKANAMFIKVN